MNTSTSSGLSSVQKACRILATLSEPGPHRLSNIVGTTSINKATALRLLGTLIDEGFVNRSPHDKNYSLGNEALVMRAAVPRRTQFPECARESLVRLAEISGDVACLSISCGSHAVCIAREEGSFPLRANYLHIGRRLPLGVGSGALAILGWLPDEEIAYIMALNHKALERFPLVNADLILREIRAARQRGYVLVSNVVCEGTGGIAVPILDEHNRPIAALSSTALSTRLVTRQDMLANLLRSEAQLIQDSLRWRTSPFMASKVKAAEVADADA